MFLVRRYIFVCFIENSMLERDYLTRLVQQFLAALENTENLLRLQSDFAINEFLYRVNLLAELYLHVGCIKTSVKEQQERWKKSWFLLGSIDKQSDTFSFDRSRKNAKISELLKQEGMKYSFSIKKHVFFS